MSNGRIDEMIGQQGWLSGDYAVVWNARFHHKDHLDFVKHLINAYLLKMLYINSWWMTFDITWQSLGAKKSGIILMEARALNNFLCDYTEKDVSTKARGRR